MRKSTMRKDIMIKKLSELKTETERLQFCADRFNDMAITYCFEYEVVNYDEQKNCYVECEDDSRIYESIDDFCGEISYWLSCYYELGHCRHDECYHERLAFLRFLEVFKPYCKKDIKSLVSSWLPRNKETIFLFRGNDD